MHDISKIEWITSFYGCDKSDAIYYLDLREEGYNAYQAGVMTGLIDPDYGEDEE